MDAPALVPATEIGVVAAPGAAGVGKDEDALLVVHESRGFCEIRRCRTALDAEPVAAFHRCAGAAGDLGDKIGAEAVQYLVKRALHRRQ